MKAGQVVFKNLLGEVQYRIPLFQRTYDWSEPQWERLWDDLSAIYGMDVPRNHFMGSLVTQQVTTVAGRVSQYVLIDGQQRMTTLLILLGVIRDKARGKSDKWPRLADEIQDLYLTNQYRHGDEQPKLMPSKRDHAPFIKIIEGEIPDAASRVGQAWQYFDAKLSAGDANGDEIDLAKLKVCVTDCLDIVSVALDPRDNPNRIFESLNYTGLQLNAADLIRNYLFMNIRDAVKQDAAYERHWYPMQEELARNKTVDRPTAFFWRFLTMDGSLIKQDRDVIFDGVRSAIGSTPDDDKIIDALKEFHEFSGYYMEAVDPIGYGKSEAVSVGIYHLHWWGAAAAVNTFLMKSISHVHRGDISEDELATVINMIESFLVRRHIRGYTQAGLRNIFARMLRTVKFTEGEFVESSLSVLLNYYWPSDAEFIHAFSWFRLYVPNARYARARLVLETIERSFEQKEAPDPSGENVSIEHIMPQALTRQWRDALGPNSVEIHSRRVHTLGNLTLTESNQAMSNRTFPSKKTILARSNFALNWSVKDKDEWNEEIIQRRGRMLAERAADIWVRP